MSKPIIEIVNLSKKYKIGTRQTYYELGDSFVNLIKNPLSILPKRIKPKSDGQNTEIWALHNISFKVSQGDRIGIIGRNGAGKSTLLKILGRITAPTKGKIHIRGRIASLLEVGTGFHPSLTGRENIFLNGSILRMSRSEIQRQFDEIVYFAEIEKFLDTPVKHYSSGMYMRLAFAVAAHLRAEVLLVDEVLAVGDAKFQKKCLEKMTNIHNSGKTIIFVSHNMSAVSRLCDRALLLDEGKLIKQGTVGIVMSEYIKQIYDTGSMRIWKNLDHAPGTEELKLQSVALVDNNNTPVVQVNVEKPAKLKLMYVVKKPGLRFRCAASFYTQAVCAFASVEKNESNHEEAGTYCSTLNIPENLLAEGEYSVTVSIFSSRGAKNRYVYLPDATVFQVVDFGKGTSARGDYMEGFGGVMRPLLSWKTFILNN